jgi:polyphosphate kinase
MLEQLKKRSEEREKKFASIQERMTKAVELTKIQMEMRMRLDEPSKNALDSKYKNGLVSDINDIEQQKIDILKTILGDGFDPMINILDENGGSKEMALSAYVKSVAEFLPPDDKVVPPPAPTVPGEPKKVGKFMVYNGGKNDGTTH